MRERDKVRRGGDEVGGEGRWRMAEGES